MTYLFCYTCMYILYFHFLWNLRTFYAFLLSKGKLNYRRKTAAVSLTTVYQGLLTSSDWPPSTTTDRFWRSPNSWPFKLQLLQMPPISQLGKKIPSYLWFSCFSARHEYKDLPEFSFLSMGTKLSIEFLYVKITLILLYKFPWIFIDCM